MTMHDVVTFWYFVGVITGFIVGIGFNNQRL